MIKEVEIPQEGASILKFYASWCAPCSELTEILESQEVSEFLEERSVKLIPVDFDEQVELVEKFNIKKIPCLIFLKNGQEVSRSQGKIANSKLELLKTNVDLIS